jgi:hypothetical protein
VEVLRLYTDNQSVLLRYIDVNVPVASGHGRAEVSAPVSVGAQHQDRCRAPAVRAESVRGSPVVSPVGVLISAAAGGSPRVQQDRRVGAQLGEAVANRRAGTTCPRVPAPGRAQGSPRRLQEIDAGATLNAEDLVAGARAHRARDDPDRADRNHRPSVGRVAASVLTQGGAARARPQGGTVAAAVVAAAGDYAGFGLNKEAALGAELLADRLAPSTMDRLESQIIRFFLFMEGDDGRDGVLSGQYDIMLYVGDLYLSGTVGGSSVAGYVSANNSFYKHIGLPAPGHISPRTLHPIVRGALKDTSGARPPVRR